MSAPHRCCAREGNAFICFACHSGPVPPPACLQPQMPVMSRQTHLPIQKCTRCQPGRWNSDTIRLACALVMKWWRVGALAALTRWICVASNLMKALDRVIEILCLCALMIA